MTEKEKEPVKFPQETLDRATELTTKLCENVLLKQLLAAMLSSRQLYSMTRVELANTLPALLPDEDEDMIALCEEVFVQSIASKDGTPFESEDLLTSVHSVVLPFIVNANQIREAEEQERVSRSQIAEEGERRDRMLPMYFGLDKGVEPELKLGQILVLVGKQCYLNWLLDQQINTCLVAKPRRRVLRLVTDFTNRVEQKKDIAQRGYATIVPGSWKAASSTNKWDKAMPGWVAKLQAPVDLVVINNATLTDFSKLHGALPEMKVTAAHKAIRKHAADCGYTVIMGMPIEGDLPDMSTNTWRSLREFAVIRPVWAEDIGEGKVKLNVGKDAWSKELDKEYIEAQ